MVKLRKDCASTLTQCCVAIVKIYTTDVNGTLRIFLDAGGIEEVISTLRRYKSESRLQQAGLWLLWTLAQQEELRTRIAAGSGAGVVITAMQTHPSDAAVQEQALWCIYWLAVQPPRNQIQVELLLEGPDLIKLAISNHGRCHQGINDFAPLCLSILLQHATETSSSLRPASPQAMPKEDFYLSPYQRLMKRISPTSAPEKLAEKAGKEQIQQPRRVSTISRLLKISGR